MERLLAAISHYGYLGLFASLMFGIVGLPIPDETILVFCGYLIASGRMAPVPAFLCGWAGAVAGISLSYLIGRTIGVEVIERYGRFIHLTPSRLQRVHEWFAKLGNWLLTFGYFLIGVRHFTALVAGISRLEFGTFARYAWCGAVLWVATFLAVGYAVGENWREALHFVHKYTWTATLVLCACGGAAWLIWKHRQP